MMKYACVEHSINCSCDLCVKAVVYHVKKQMKKEQDKPDESGYVPHTSLWWIEKFVNLGYHVKIGKCFNGRYKVDLLFNGNSRSMVADHLVNALADHSYIGGVIVK